jgi:hypothetical protein
VVPLGGKPGHHHQGKRAVRTTTTIYDGTKDVDTLDLRCAPRP